MPMNLRQIEAFRAVMLTGSVSAAAQLLCITQPAVTKILQYIESRLARRLFERVKGRLVPTPEARELFVEVQRMWRGVERVQQLSGRLGRGPAAQLRLVVSPSLGSWLLPTLLRGMLADLPSLGVRVEVTARQESTALLLDHAADLGLGIGPFDHPGITEEAVADGRLVCAVPSGHPLARRKRITARDLARTDLVTYEPDADIARAIERQAGDALHDLRPRIEVRSSQAACWFVQRGVGVALVDEFALLGASFPGIVGIPFWPRTGLQLVVAWGSTAPLSDAGVRLVETLRATKELRRPRQPGA